MKDDKLILTEEDLEKSISNFTSLLDIYPRTSRREIIRAVQWSRQLHEGQKRASGEPYIIHPLKTAEILVELKMDPTTIMGALLHDVLEDTLVNRDELVKVFGEEVANLVDGVTKIDDIKLEKRSRQAASLRKMLWAMVSDIRVIFIKLADKRHNMNTLGFIQENERRLRIVRECLEIYAPMAGKLGMSSLRYELEDLSLKYLKPDYYARIRNHVVVKREERSQHLNEVKDKILHRTAKLKMKVKVEARAKHFYSIYRKMKERNKRLYELYDLLGMRIICDSSNACYIILGVIHNIWKPIDGRFKDYIACPKSNGYQSLHTAVFTEGGFPLEIQIRSQKMHETAEYGFAAHWAYKEGKLPGQVNSEQIAVVKQLQELKKEGFDKDPNEFLEMIRRDVLRNSIIVYTPKGDPVELPEGSTAIDFAYYIHSEIGDHCIGAKANDSIIPLTQPLRNTQKIQVMTSQKAHPHVNWLRHVRSTRARSRIRAWLNHHDNDVLVSRDIVVKRAVPEKAQRKRKTDDKTFRNTVATETVNITAGSERNVMIKLAQCCSPSLGDPIVGYVSRGRGLIVHNASCRNLQGIGDIEERLIHVQWEVPSSKNTQEFQIHALYVNDLFSRIENAIRKYHGHLVSGKLEETERGDLHGFFTVEMDNPDVYKRISKKIRAIPAVQTITKVQSHHNRFDF